MASPQAPNTPKKLFNRYEFKQRIATLRAQAKAADDAYYGSQTTECKLYTSDEVRANPTLRWLDVGARMEYINRPRDQVAPTRLPPLPALLQTATVSRSQQRLRHPQVTLEPLVDECGTAVQCPICLRDMCHDELPSDSTPIRWSGCCGRAFHGHCFLKLSRCPMCRTWPLREAITQPTTATADDAARLPTGTTMTTNREIVLPKRVDCVRVGCGRSGY